ncbi:MAG: hypothetical protein E6R14_05620 [Thermomicrobiales bacterium]|nr:MAG: hypothetical protein E6R14_05620 [Thermomicrobiales bacterium]
MSKSKSQAETDLDLARERLSFYEQFDEIIRQNIASSSALLKEASARLDSDFAVERSRYRAVLTDVLDDLTTLQAQSEKLARRVTDALDELEGGQAQPAAAPAIAGMGLVTEAPPEAAAVVNAATAAPSPRKKAEKPKPVEAAASIAAASPDPISAPVTPPNPIAPAQTATTTLLVHGVPRASAALGLKGYIEKLEFVSSVEPREFAAGLLRLQVDGARPLSLGDLASWPLADRIALRNAGNELLEIDLAPA